MPPLETAGPVICPMAPFGKTSRTCVEVPGAVRRLTLAVVRTKSPAMNPPAGRVGVRVEVAAPGVRVMVAGAAVRVGVGVENVFR